MVNTVHACGIKPLISINPSGNIIFDYSFRGSEDYDKHIFENVIDRTLEMHQLDELIRIIESIESSKIWKIRSLLMKLLGRKVLKLSEYLSSIEDESIEKRFTEIHLYLKKIKESNCWKIWQKWVNFKRSIQHF
jgi:hypothetical protein